MRKNQIAVGGTSANPPHIGHLSLSLEVMKSGFMEDILIPCGRRRDKAFDAHSMHRRQMMEMTFFYSDNPLSLELQEMVRNGERFVVDYFDIYRQMTPTIRVIERMKRIFEGCFEVVWFTGVDVLVPQEKFRGKCEMDTWVEGERLKRENAFLVLPRTGYPDPASLGLPPNFEILKTPSIPDISSTQIRSMINKGEQFEHMVTPEVAAYIKENRLYGWKGGAQ